MGLPDSGRYPLAGDVTQSDSQHVIKLHHFEKISGQMTHWKDFAGDFKVAPYQFARGTEFPLDLRGFVDCLLEYGVLATHSVQLLLDRVNVFGSGRHF